MLKREPQGEHVATTSKYPVCLVAAFWEAWLKPGKCQSVPFSGRVCHISEDKKCSIDYREANPSAPRSSSTSTLLSHMFCESEFRTVPRPERSAKRGVKINSWCPSSCTKSSSGASVVLLLSYTTRSLRSCWRAGGGTAGPSSFIYDMAYVLLHGLACSFAFFPLSFVRLPLLRVASKGNLRKQNRARCWSNKRDAKASGLATSANGTLRIFPWQLDKEPPGLDSYS